MEFISKEHSKEEVTSLLHPVIRNWFETKFERLTPPQSMAIPHIHNKENILVSSPTGSGKTITAFLSIINELYSLQVEGKLEDRIYCVYVSPLKALANDINKNLKTPLEEMAELTKEQGEELGPAPKIRVAVRSGDTSSYERSRMVKKPPHIFITTPESLALVLSTPKFREKFSDVQYLIVDEIHDISDSKRGVLLSLTVERLQHYVSSELTRIGLSATQAPIEEIGKFLVGYHKLKREDGSEYWDTRPLKIVEVQKPKLLDIQVLSPVENMNKFNYEIINTKMQDLLPNLIKSHKSTIVFTNTRSATETLVHALKERGVESVAAHHGSLSKEVRIDVENRLKTGELKTVVTSTSLELGIDVGYVDLVCQIGSPKTVAKALQRIGRAGHSMVAVSKGRLIVYDKDDLVECAVLSKFARAGKIDRIFILKNCQDVLSQTLVGMSLEKRYDVDEALDLIKSSYCYQELTKEKFVKILGYISGSDIEGIYGKIWHDPKTNSFGKKRGSRLIYYTNIGTIPPESNYYVKLVGTGYPVGQLSEKFVENLREGDIFILGGKTYQFLKTGGMEVFVKDAFGRKPTVPSWTGELLPRSYDLSVGIGAFRRKVGEHLLQREKSCEKQLLDPGNGEAEEDTDKLDEGGLQEKQERVDFNSELMHEYSLDLGSANTIIDYLCEQMKFHPQLPTDRHIVIEGYLDPKGLYNAIVHSCFGRRANDALSRAYAYKLTEQYGFNVRISLTDDNFILTTERPMNLKDLPTLLKPEELEDILVRAVKDTELFNQRFRHCASRSLMILRSYKGKEISIERQQMKTTKIIQALTGIDDFPVVEETYNEILNDAMNITTAKEILVKLASEEITTSFIDYNDVPSPLAHNIILMGVSDIVLMEDRSSLLRELHSKVLEKALDQGTIVAKFKPSLVKAHFRAKLPEVNKKEDILEAVRELGGLHIFTNKKEYIATFSEHPDPLLRLWALEHICAQKLVDVKAKDDIWVLREDYPDMRNIYAKNVKLTPEQKKIYTRIREFSHNFFDFFQRSRDFCDCADNSQLVLSRKEFETSPTSRPYIEEFRELKKLAKELFTKKNHKLIEKLHGAYMVYGSMMVNPFKLRQQKLMVGDILSEDNGETMLRQHADKVFSSLDKIYEKIYLVPSEELVQDPKPFEESLYKVVSQHLKFYAPAIVEGLSVSLNIAKNLVFESLQTLEKRNVLTSGNFLPELPPRQYIYIEDLLNLEAKTKGKYEIVQEDLATQFIYNNHFKQEFEGIRETLDHFGTLSSKLDIFSHHPGFSPVEWRDLRKSEEVLTGRFLGGKVSSTIPEYLSNYLPVYRIEKPDSFQERVLDFLRERAASISTLVQKLEVDRNQLKGALSFLDKNLYIQRAYIETERIANDYVAISDPDPDTEEERGDREGEEVTPDRGEALKDLIVLYLKANAPASFQLLRRMLRLYRREITLALDQLEREGRIQQVYVIGQIKELRYILTDQLEEIRNTELETNGARIVSLTDPYIYRYISEIRMRYGDGWFYPIVRNKRVVGMVNAWKRSDSLEIRELDVFEPFEDEEAVVEEMVDAIEQFFEFFRVTGTSILKIRRLFRKDIKDLEGFTRRIFRERGFRRIHTWFVKGDILGRTYEKRDIINYMMYRYHFIWPDIKANLGNHSDEKLIPVLKDRTLDAVMKRLLVVIPPNRLVARAELLKILGLKPVELDVSLRALEDTGYILRKGQAYQKNQRVTTISKENAEKQLVLNKLKEFGILNISNIHKFLRGNFTLRTIKDVLEVLRKEEKVEQGYFVKDDEKLYYILHGEEKQMLRNTFRGNALIFPEGRLYKGLEPVIKMMFPMQNPGLIFRRGKMVGAFSVNDELSTTRTIHIDLFGEGEDVLQEHYRKKKLAINEIELG